MKIITFYNIHTFSNTNLYQYLEFTKIDLNLRNILIEKLWQPIHIIINQLNDNKALWL